MKVSLPPYFEFLSEFLFVFNERIGDGIVKMLHIVVQRVLEEMRTVGGKKNFNVNRCWNVIRAIFENKNYIPKFLIPLEDEVKPLFELLQNPEDIDFDDDIALLLSSIMKLSGNVLDTCKILYPLTPKIHMKFNGIFGNLLQTMNLFLKLDNAWIAASPERVQILHEMSLVSMFYSAQKGFAKQCACDGSLLL